MPGKRGGGGDPRDQFWEALMREKTDTLTWCLRNCGSLTASTQHSESGLTGLMMAAANGKVKSLGLLLDFYAKSQTQRESGWVECAEEGEGKTAMMLAAERGFVRCVDLLLDAEAKGRGERLKPGQQTLGEKQLLQKDNKGKTARDLAQAARKTEVVELIDDFLAPPDEAAEEKQGRDEEGKSSTQRSKEKKRELLAAAGDGTYQKALREEEERKREIAEKEAKVQETLEAAKKSPPVWAEVKKAEASADLASKLCELTIVRDKPGEDCPCPGALSEEDGIDPALWRLFFLNRLSLKLPSGVLRTLPEAGISRLQALQVLIVSGNALTSLPDCVGSFPVLRVLEAERNALTALPDSIGNCEKLEVVKVSANKIDSLAPLEKLTTLTTVTADDNALTSLDGINFAALPRISVLSFQNNKIVEIPEDIGKCAVLAEVNMVNNQVAVIPSEITALKKVRKLDLANNPIADPKVRRYLEAGAKGLKDLWKYLEKQEKKGGGGKKGKKGKKKGKKAAESEDEDEESDE